MKRYSELKVGDTFYSACSISEGELGQYLDYSRVRNAFLDGAGGSVVPGRAILARMEGEFTRLGEIYGNHLVLVGMDGDPGWGSRQARFLRPLCAGEPLKLSFTVSRKQDGDGGFGRIWVDYEGVGADGKTVLVSKGNVYRVKKDP